MLRKEWQNIVANNQKESDMIQDSLLACGFQYGNFPNEHHRSGLFIGVNSDLNICVTERSLCCYRVSLDSAIRFAANRKEKVVVKLNDTYEARVSRTELKVADFVFPASIIEELFQARQSLL